jgi:hypothetical protein
MVNKINKSETESTQKNFISLEIFSHSQVCIQIQNALCGSVSTNPSLNNEDPITIVSRIYQYFKDDPTKLKIADTIIRQIVQNGYSDTGGFGNTEMQKILKSSLHHWNDLINK